MDTFHFLETKRHQELNICSSIRIVSQLIMIVVTIVVITESQCLMPFQANFLPLLKPVQFSARLHEELHFHLFELTHTENELTGNNLVTECLTNLCNTKRYLHTAGLLYIQVVHKDTLSCFRTQVNLHGTIRSRTHLCREHQVELTNFRPVLCTADRANDFFIHDNLAKLVKVIIIQSLCKTFVQCVTFSLVFQYATVCATELCFIKRLSETLGSFGNFFIDLIVVLCKLVFNQYIGTITLLGITVVNQRVIECVYVSGSLPDGGVHKDSGVDADNVFVQQHHALPPVLFNVVFQFYTHLTVVIHCSQSIIDVAGGEYETVFLTV